jgi:hypothetical protein
MCVAALAFGCSSAASSTTDDATASTLSAGTLCNVPVTSADLRYAILDHCPAGATSGRLVRLDRQTHAEVVIDTYAPTDRITNVAGYGDRFVYATLANASAQGATGWSVSVHDWSLTTSSKVQAPAGEETLAYPGLVQPYLTPTGKHLVMRGNAASLFIADLGAATPPTKVVFKSWAGRQSELAIVRPAMADDGQSIVYLASGSANSTYQILDLRSTPALSPMAYQYTGHDEAIVDHSVSGTDFLVLKTGLVGPGNFAKDFTSGTVASGVTLVLSAKRGGQLLWTLEQTSPSSSANIVRHDLAPGGATTVVATDVDWRDRAFYGGQLSFDQTMVFHTMNGDLWSVPADGGSPPTLLLASATVFDHRGKNLLVRGKDNHLVIVDEAGATHLDVPYPQSPNGTGFSEVALADSGTAFFAREMCSVGGPGLSGERVLRVSAAGVTEVVACASRQAGMLVPIGGTRALYASQKTGPFPAQYDFELIL